MDESRTPWPEPTEDPHPQEEGGSKVLEEVLFLDFSSTNENSGLEKMTLISIALQPGFLSFNWTVLAVSQVIHLK